MHPYCHRCQAELPAHDEGTLIFCVHCGAPQVLLSEELKAQIESSAKVAETEEGARQTPRDPRTLVWPAAMRPVAMAAAIAAVLTVVSTLLPPAILLAWLWAVVSPVVVMGIFQARSPGTPITTSFGARLGLLTGLAIAAVMSVINTAALLVLRRSHGLDDFDRQWAVMLDQLQARIVEQSGPSAAPLAHAFALPEFRAGVVLTGVAMASAFLLVVTTAGGAFAGFVRSRRRA